MTNDNALQSELEIFFPTKDRDDSLVLCLESIREFCPNCTITIANCSTDQNKTSELIRGFGPEINEIKLKPNIGIAESFQILIANLSRNFCLWLSDDLVLLRPLEEAIRTIEENKHLDFVGMPFIDEIHFQDAGWPKDEFGCAKWINNKGIRVGHFAIAKREILINVSKIISPSHQIDYAIQNEFTNTNNYQFITGPAFMKHDRHMDETRKNRIK